jgi:hypothetical protein
MTSWLTLVAGALLGAMLQYWFGQRAEARRHRRDKRADAYAEYLRAIAAAARIRDDDDRRAVFKDFAAAKTRIVVYGSRPVVGAVAHFEEAGATATTPEGEAAVIAVCRAMRAEHGRDEVSDKDLRSILIGP